MNTYLQQVVTLHAQEQAAWPPPKPKCGYEDCNEKFTWIIWYKSGLQTRVTLSCTKHLDYLQNQVPVISVEEFKR